MPPLRAGGLQDLDDRPHACRTFACVWLMDPDMPHRFRPDQTKVVLDQDAAGTASSPDATRQPGRWRRNPMYAALKDCDGDNWGKGRIVLGDSRAPNLGDNPKSDVDLGEIDPRADSR